MTKFIRTLSGSLYEWDEKNKQVRRLSGVKEPTERQGADLEWRAYEEIMLAVNRSMIIVWSSHSDNGGELICKTTQTSSIEAIGDSLAAVVAVN